MSDGEGITHRINPARGREALASGDMTYEEVCEFASALLDTLEIMARAVLILHAPDQLPRPRSGPDDDEAPGA